MLRFCVKTLQFRHVKAAKLQLFTVCTVLYVCFHKYVGHLIIAAFFLQTNEEITKRRCMLVQHTFKNREACPRPTQGSAPQPTEHMS